jgi:hypothetical protein
MNASEIEDTPAGRCARIVTWLAILTLTSVFWLVVGAVAWQSFRP